ncbi:MAG: hypothetical protein BGO27_08160 [Alphaproteobacteria bacterium 33-17]|nr:MAG: hypothetical protein BGO27_08160 [Alphaproteobacteria bacterium 33-17]
MKQIKNEKKSSKDIFSIVRDAIKEVDRGLFFIADHNKQAYNVIKSLEMSGFMIVPKSPNDDMLAAGKERISYGLTSSKDLVKQIYESMINVI